MRVPANSFHSSLMLWKSCKRLSISHVPNKKLIVVSSWGKLSVIKAPLHSTDLLLMSLKCVEVVFRTSQIMHHDVSISWSWADDIVIPTSDSNSALMASHWTDHFPFCNVPYLNISGVGTDWEIISFRRPVDTCDKVVWW